MGVTEDLVIPVGTPTYVRIRGEWVYIEKTTKEIIIRVKTSNEGENVD